MIDIEQTRQFLDTLFGGYQGDAKLSVTVFQGQKCIKQEWLGPMEMADIEEVLRYGAARPGSVVSPPVALFSDGTNDDGRRSAAWTNACWVSAIVLDLDGSPFLTVEEGRQVAETNLGPATFVVRSGGVTDAGENKLHLYWKLDAPATTEGEFDRIEAVRQELAALCGGDLSASSVVHPMRLPGSLHLKGSNARVCEILVSRPRQTLILAEAESALQIDTSKPKTVNRRNYVAPSEPPLPADLLMQCAEIIPHLDDTRDTWVKVAHKFHAASHGSDTGLEAFDHWSQKWPGYDEDHTHVTWAGLNPRTVSVTSLLRHADPALYRRYAVQQAFGTDDDSQVVVLSLPPSPPTHGERAALVDAASGDVTVDFSEDHLALVFADRYGQTLKHVARWGSWLLWDGNRWVKEETHHAFDLARDICRRAATAHGMQANQAKAIARANTVAAVERLAKADRRIAATADQWDNDPWLLATPNGTIDLRTGLLRTSLSSDFCTKSTAVAPLDNADCPIWLDFLNTTFAGDRELISFVQRLAGYALTGVIKEHMLAFGYGTGGNGKGVFLNTLTGLLGDYAVVAPAEVFQESRIDKHSTELARLHGARFVTAQETEEGRRWAESRIKALTGGDPITARFMRQDDFTYTPQFKLFIAGNHKPGLRGVDEAIRRRLHLIPFSVTVPRDGRDPALPEKLQAEWPAILRWAIDGCLEWQRIGLLPPMSVQNATDEYLADEDAIERWIAECCQRLPTERTSSTLLWQSFRAWAGRAGEAEGSQKRFSQNLDDRGFVRERARDGAYFIGLRIGPNAVERAFSSAA